MAKKVMGFGQIKETTSLILHSPLNANSILDLPAGTCPRGAGKAYGDASTNHGGNIVLTKKLNKILEIDAERLFCRVESGVLIYELMERLAVSGLTLFVVPGSAYISIGGCFASDVHGKNHTSVGSFADYVTEVSVQDTQGNSKKIIKGSELFAATAGGMGMTGLIVEITIKCAKIETGIFETLRAPFNSISECLDKLEVENKRNEQVIAWLDLTSKRNFGRGIVYSASRARDKTQIGIYPKKPKLIPIPNLQINLMSRVFIRFYNAARFRMECREKAKLTHESYWKVLFPSDLFINWNNLFGSRGLMEYQFLIPFENKKEIEKIFTLLTSLANPALVAIKVLGSANENYISFPAPGFLCGVTFPWRDTYKKEIHIIDDYLLQVGGKKYLSKDIFTKKETLLKMYPNHSKYIQVKKKIDPFTSWQSDLYRRVFG